MAEYAKNLSLGVDQLKPDVVGHVFTGDGTELKDLTGFTSPKFYLYDLTAQAYKLDGVTTGVSISDEANGEVTYEWQTGDTGTASLYRAWFSYEPTTNKPELATGIDIHIKQPWELGD